MRPRVLGFRPLPSALLGLCLSAMSACAHEGPALELDPHAVRSSGPQTELPTDPFPTESESSAYSQLRAGTDAARAEVWDGELESFALWLESQTDSMENALRRLADLRTGRADQYGVASGRIALAYEHIAGTVDRAVELAETRGMQPEWKELSLALWERAQLYWARCAKVTAAGPPHLDAWKMRCAGGSQSALASPARQSK